MKRLLFLLLIFTLLIGCVPVPKEPAELKIYPLKPYITHLENPYTFQVFGYDENGNEVELNPADLTWEITFPEKFYQVGYLYPQDSRVAMVWITNTNIPTGTHKLKVSYHGLTFSRTVQVAWACPNCWDDDADGIEFIPEPIIIEPEPTEIVCEGGIYKSYYNEWSFCGCPGCNTFPRGTYWLNQDRVLMFLLGEPVVMAPQVYGKCPSEYIEAFEIPEQFR